MDKNQLVSIGKCVRAHGIKGAAQLNLYNSQSRILQKSTGVYLRLDGNKSSDLAQEIDQDLKLYHIQDISYSSINSLKSNELKNNIKIILSFKQILDRTQMEKLLPFEVLIPRSIFPENLADNEYYLVDLVGLRVQEENQDKEIGYVEGFYDHGAGTIVKIKLNQSLKESELASNGHIELPFKDYFFPNICLKNKLISVRLPQLV